MQMAGKLFSSLLLSLLPSVLCFPAGCVSAPEEDLNAPLHVVGTKLKVDLLDDIVVRRLTIRLGPLNLLAHTGHSADGHPRVSSFRVSFDWVAHYIPSINGI